jgi:hypothetical protein
MNALLHQSTQGYMPLIDHPIISSCANAPAHQDDYFRADEGTTSSSMSLKICDN